MVKTLNNLRNMKTYTQPQTHTNNIVAYNNIIMVSRIGTSNKEIHETFQIV